MVVYSRSIAIFLTLICASVLFLTAPLAWADANSASVQTSISVPTSGSGGCPNPNERPATAGDLAMMKAAGYPDSYVAVGNCWAPGSKYVGTDPAEAKQYLRSILCPPDADNYGGMGPDGTIYGINGVGGLDSQFAVCAASFLKAAQQQGIQLCIREGARSVAKQNEYVARGVIACKRGAMCEHPRGIAIDVNVRPNVNDCNSYKALHASAPSFGLSFYLGCKDAYHFVPMKSGCSAGGVVQPNAPLPPSYYDNPQYAPSANPFQTPGNPTQIPPPQPIPQQQAAPISPTQPVTPVAPPVTPTPVVPVTPVIPVTPTPITPLPTSTAVVPITPVTPIVVATSTSTNVPISPNPIITSTSSWIDLITSVAQMNDPLNAGSSTQTSTSINLNNNLTELSRQLNAIFPAPTDGSSNTLASATSGSPRYVIVQGVIAPETFTSGTIGQSGNMTDAQTPPNTSLLLSILAQLRAGLEHLIGILSPVRAGVPASSWAPPLYAI